MIGAGLHLSGGPTVEWKVTIHFEDGTCANVALGSEHVCYRHGRWQATSPKKALDAAVELLVDRYRETVERSMRSVEITDTRSA